MDVQVINKTPRLFFEKIFLFMGLVLRFVSLSLFSVQAE